MKCPYCGAELRNNVRFCGNCGNNVSAASTATPSNSGITLPNSLSTATHLQGDRYAIKKILGQGGMGTALLATDSRLDGKLVVIKELISDNVDQQRRLEDVRNFKREVATLAHIDHPLVPNVTDHFQEGTRYFMVQEYIEGENLEERLERTQKPFSEREALICASEILDILEYLAQQVPPIMHRDIKPANVIIGAKDRRAHLVDFGIARTDEVRNAQHKQTSALGTPGYAPPEQYQGNADARSDLYALAATLHHILTNRDPRGETPFQYPLVRTLNPALSPEIEQVLAKTLQVDMKQRYQSATAMKFEIDTILRQRFGVSGNIDSYTLGNSGQIPKITNSTVSSPDPAQAVTQQGTIPTTLQTPQQLGQGSWAQTTPVPPTLLPSVAPVASGNTSSPTYPVYPQIQAGQQPQPSQQPQPQWQPARKRRHTGLIIVLTVLLVLLLAGGSLLIYANLGKKTTSTLSVTMVNGEPIGISDGTTAIDTTLEDGALKIQAAQAFKQANGNYNATISLLNQALGKNENDAEALIYQENIHVLTSGSPYVTLVIATMLSGDQIQVGRDNLQGAYVAQKEYNDGSKLHGGILVRLLIANTGSPHDPSLNYNVPRVVQQIVQLQQSDPTVIGVMGWPFSGRTQAAISTLSNAHIPLVSQTSSSDMLTNASPYFFRIVPSNQIQGIQGAKYAEQNLHAKKVALFYDDQDSYSQSLAQDFRQQFVNQDKNQVVEEKYTIGKADTISSAVQQTLRQNIDLIYFSGYASDVSTLLSNLPAGNLPVMGGDALYELGGYQSSARAKFNRLRFTAFAYPDEWDVLNHSAQKPDFFMEYTAAFTAYGPHTGGSYGFTRADNDVILSYDATIALLTAYNNALNTGKQHPTVEDERQALHTLNGTNAIQGVSGQIAFGANGDPTDKAIVVLYVDPMGRIHMEPTLLGRFLK
ncbi:protein kinase domain-containing protein [Dictyobacter arantiisoli]|uniref:non-specific serine/threonine protein kinase n=1 Tax=Dictyobacter arantiisoli TaxID=2014874 RepID=A0A5A5TFJ2_9CHLR|nr:ABC transporter substrate-binding protein [Dictyobacter arantiisoli]GCF09684.1 hypothetical protein KDI_32480 [Dictyobacter arantiisoli]